MFASYGPSSIAVFVFSVILSVHNATRTNRLKSLYSMCFWEFVHQPVFKKYQTLNSVLDKVRVSFPEHKRTGRSIQLCPTVQLNLTPGYPVSVHPTPFVS